MIDAGDPLVILGIGSGIAIQRSIYGYMKVLTNLCDLGYMSIILCLEYKRI